MHFTIEDLTATDTASIEGAAKLLHAAFSPLGVWTTLTEARQEVLDSISADRVSRVALNAEGAVVGWIGAIREYDGLVWQLHPIVVDAAQRRHGVGRALVQDLEAILLARGALTLWAGSDDLAGDIAWRRGSILGAPGSIGRGRQLGQPSVAVLSSPRLSGHRRDAGCKWSGPPGHLSGEKARRVSELASKGLLRKLHRHPQKRRESLHFSRN